VVALVMGCTYKKQACKMCSVHCFFHSFLFVYFSLFLCALTVIIPVSHTAMLELSASYGSQVCINAGIPEIVSLRDRFL
jgi:hypothetical protein